MVNVRQLELDLGDAFEDATDMPEEANFWSYGSSLRW